MWFVWEMADILSADLVQKRLASSTWLRDLVVAMTRKAKACWFCAKSVACGVDKPRPASEAAEGEAHFKELGSCMLAQRGPWFAG